MAYPPPSTLTIGHSRAAFQFPPTSSTSSVVLSSTLSSAESVDATMYRMVTYLRRTRLHLLPFFVDYDTHKSGLITSSQFGRGCSLAGFGKGAGVGAGEMAGLSLRYAAAGDNTSSADGSVSKRNMVVSAVDMVNYRALIRDLNAAVAEEDISFNAAAAADASSPAILDFAASIHSNALMPVVADYSADPPMRSTQGGGALPSVPFVTFGPTHTAASPLTVGKLIHKLQTLCQVRRIVLSDLFADYDPLRQSMVTPERFRRALDVANFRLSEVEVTLLASHYRSAKDAGQVDYASFIRNIEAPFMPQTALRQPSVVLEAFTPYDLGEHETPGNGFSPAEEARVQAILELMGAAVHTRRIEVRAPFLLHDSSRSGCVSLRLFKTIVAATFTSVRLSVRDLELLAGSYARAQSGVCYTRFVQHVLDAENRARDDGRRKHSSYSEDAEFIAQQAGYGAPLSPTNVPAPGRILAGMRLVSSTSDRDALASEAMDPESVFARLRASIQRHRTSGGGLDDLFRDHDALNKGRITHTQFKRCLTNAGLKLNEKDIELMGSTYAINGNEVDYRRFAKEMSDIPMF